MLIQPMKKGQLSILAILLLMGVWAIPGYAAPSSAEKQWTIKGTIQATETYKLNLETMTMLVVAKGTGNSSHLGQFTYEYEGTVNLLTGQGWGWAELVAANGDRLFAELHGQGTPVEPPDLHQVVEEYIITGGTGRFANASGSLALERLVNTATGVTFGTIQGNLLMP